MKRGNCFFYILLFICSGLIFLFPKFSLAQNTKEVETTNNEWYSEELEKLRSDTAIQRMENEMKAYIENYKFVIDGRVVNIDSLIEDKLNNLQIPGDTSENFNERQTEVVNIIDELFKVDGKFDAKQFWQKYEDLKENERLEVLFYFVNNSNNEIIYDTINADEINFQLKVLISKADKFTNEIVNAALTGQWEKIYIPNESGVIDFNPQKIKDRKQLKETIQFYKEWGDCLLKKNEQIPAFNSYYSAFPLVVINMDTREFADLQHKIANVYDWNRGSKDYKKKTIGYLLNADQNLRNIGIDTTYYKYQALRIKWSLSFSDIDDEELFSDYFIDVIDLHTSLFENLNNKQKIYLFQTLAYYFGYLNDFSTAEKYAKYALLLALFDNKEFTSEIEWSLNIISWVNSRLGNYDEFVYYFDNLLYFKENTSYDGVPHYLTALAWYLINLKDYNAAADNLDKAYNLGMKLNNFNHFESLFYQVEAELSKINGGKNKSKNSKLSEDYSTKSEEAIVRRNATIIKFQEVEMKYNSIALQITNNQSIAVIQSLQEDQKLSQEQSNFLINQNKNLRFVNDTLQDVNSMLLYDIKLAEEQFKTTNINLNNLIRANDSLQVIELKLNSNIDSLHNQSLKADSLIQASEEELEKIEDEKKTAEKVRNIAWIIAALAILSIFIAILILSKIKRKIYNLKDEAITSNIHSAISRVLTRCMSHNIGSHVLSKFLDKEQVTVADTLNQYVPFFPAEFNQAELIANFNEYLKYRMDYLADIATTTEPVMESPMYLVRDIIKGFDKNRILLNRISGVSSDKKFGLKVFCNGTEIQDGENAADPLLSFTNDILGAQAFYIILENIIRNIYKHGNPTNSFDIIINVSHSEKDRSFYEVSVYDTNYKSKSSIDAIVGKRNATFNDSVLHDNKLRDSNLGTIEMAVSASYLLCLPIDSCNSEKFRKIGNHQENESEANPDNRLIYAYTQHSGDFAEDNLNDNSYALGYKFFISKPKQVLVVSKGDFTLTGEHDDLKDKGILVAKPEEINNDFISNHQFIYFDKGVKDVITIQNQSTLPKRIVYFNESISTDTAESFIAGLWSQYSKEKFLKYNRISFKNGKRERGLDLSSNPEGGKEYKVFIDNHDERWGCRNCIEITEQCTNEEFKKSKSKEADSLQLKTGTINLANHSTNNICQPLGKYDFYDMACGHSKISKLLRSGLLSDINLQYEYAENVFTRIIVIDERIQQNIAFEPKRTYAGRMPFYDYFQQQKIFIPGKDEANLNTETFGQLNDNQQSDIITEADRIRQYIQRHIEDSTFCIIHLGILEKMLKSIDNKTIENVDPIIQQLFPTPEHRKKLVITSGRGGALNIPPDLSFIPLALLQNALETLFDKFVLTKILYNSRKCK